MLGQLLPSRKSKPHGHCMAQYATRKILPKSNCGEIKRKIFGTCLCRSVGRSDVALVLPFANQIHTHTHLHLCVGIVSCSFRAKVLHCDAWMISHSEYGRLLRLQVHAIYSHCQPLFCAFAISSCSSVCVYVCMSYRHTYMEWSLATRTNKRKQL